MENKFLVSLAAQVGQLLLAHKKMLVTAESCTGGWVAQAITAIDGSSQWFERGFVTYSNAAKQELLGVKADTLKQFGAVSENVCREMAEGALQHSHVHLSVAVTGIAGATGGGLNKPVDLVWLAWAEKNSITHTQSFQFHGNREAIRYQAVSEALQGIIKFL